MRPRIKTEPADATIFSRDWINILKALSLVHEYACVFKAGAVFKSGNITAEHACSASVQTTHEHILTFTFAAVLHNPIFASSIFLQFSQSVQEMNRYLSLWLKAVNEGGTSK